HHGVTPRQVAAGIMRTSEFRTSEVQTAYHTFLHRDASSGELAASTQFLVAGGTVEQLQTRLVVSPEYREMHGGTADGFLDGLYQDALGHGPDADVLAATARVLHPGRVAAAVFASSEYRRDLIENDFERFLFHGPDSKAEQAMLHALARGARDENVLAAI